MNNTIDILVVDDHTMVRDGLTSLLNQLKDIRVVGSCASGEEAISLTRTCHPHIIIMDVILKGMTGVEATRWIKEQSSTVKIILISGEVKKEFVAAGIRSGIDGFLPKDVSSELLLEAINTVQSGGKYFTEAITTLIFEDFYTKEKTGKKRDRKITEGLTKRESEVLELVAQGIGNKEIGDRLFISVKTVETHKSHILDKLGLKNTSELIRYAIKNNIISLD
jgi:DNA-binding NarL/FixJ family response regulator